MVNAARQVSLPANFRSMTMASGIRMNVARDPGKTALIFRDRRLSYRELAGRIDRVARMALGLGLAPGERAAVVSANCIEYIEIVDGLSEAGIAVATLNPRLTAPELGYILDDCGARVVFASPEAALLVRASGAAAVERVVVIGQEYDGLLAAANPDVAIPEVDEWSAFSIPYTSGTTGKPRGVVLPHRSRVMVGFCMASEFGCYGPDDHFLVITPMFHGAGYSFAHAAVFFGGTCEILPSFDAELTLRRLSEGGVTGTFMVPTLFNGIFALEKPLLDRYRSHALKALMCNAAPLPQKTKEIVVDYFGEGLLHEMYGSTEGGIVCNLRPRDQLRKQQCVGAPFMMNHVKLLDDAGRETKRGEVGELFNTSPCLFLEYWNNPAATDAAMRDGWFSAGDLAWQDEDGCYYIVDRKKDMYISGGVNVYPREVEELLVRLPGVRDAAVVGVADEYWGESGRAFLVMAPGSAIAPEAVIAACKEKLAGYKVPRQVAFIDVLPRNAAGKILKTELRLLP